MHALFNRLDAVRNETVHLRGSTPPGEGAPAAIRSPLLETMGWRRPTTLHRKTLSYSLSMSLILEALSSLRLLLLLGRIRLSRTLTQAQPTYE